MQNVDSKFLEVEYAKIDNDVQLMYCSKLPLNDSYDTI